MVNLTYNSKRNTFKVNRPRHKPMLITGEPLSKPLVIEVQSLNAFYYDIYTVKDLSKSFFPFLNLYHTGVSYQDRVITKSYFRFNFFPICVNKEALSYGDSNII